MKLSKKRLAASIFFAAVALAVAVMIFAFSAQQSDASTNFSSSITAMILSVFPSYKNADTASQLAMFELWHPIFRTFGHFAEFFLLGFFTTLALKGFDVGWPSTFSMLVCSLYAVTDEVHQYFVPGRACQFGDMIIDMLGVFAAVFIIFLIINRKRNRENKKRSEIAKQNL